MGDGILYALECCNVSLRLYVECFLPLGRTFLETNRNKKEVFMFSKSMTRTRLYALTCLGFLIATFSFGNFSQAFADSKANSIAVNDRAITQAILERLRREPGISGAKIMASTSKGIVTLEGTVQHLLGKRRAVQMVRTIRGVRVVIDKIKVNAVRRADGMIQSDVKIAAFYNPIVELRDLKFSVRSGVVTIRGQVHSWVERRAATRVAMQIRGVKAVHNLTTVKKPEFRNDTEMKGEIRTHMDWNLWLDARKIKVDVRKGVAYLSGAVPSAIEKERAYISAMIAGIARVDASKLKVNSSLFAKLKTNRIKPVGEKELKTYLRMAMQMELGAQAKSIQMEYNKGIITLSGNVARLIDSYKAQLIAQRTFGVYRVNNSILVKPKVVLTDKTIRQRVIRRLAMDPYLYENNLTILVVKGKVALYGTLPSYYLHKRASHLIAGIPGVRGIQNYLKNPHAKAYSKEQKTKLRQAIKNELFWTSASLHPRIRVTVKNGVVTLTGSVMTWNDFMEAEAAAFRAGAVYVRNKVKVEKPMKKSVKPLPEALSKAARK
ncbi:MAG: BON domain-containing protein [Deltaproteobacteria bacterium]|nr:MAG: BON domain-containing protein [Deltaproteobacteria bacterium]